MSAKYEIGIIGAGSWGTALAVLLNGNGHRVTMWEFRTDAVKRLHDDRENKEFLPGITLPSTLHITDDLELTCSNKQILVIAVPSHVVREVALKISEFQLNNDIFSHYLF